MYGQWACVPHLAHNFGSGYHENSGGQIPNFPWHVAGKFFTRLLKLKIQIIFYDYMPISIFWAAHSKKTGSATTHVPMSLGP